MTKRTFPSFLLFPDQHGRWRWSYADASGNEVAAGRASYATRESCMRAIRDLQQSGGQPAYAFNPREGGSDTDEGPIDLAPGQIVN